jgi:hypothetical protein
MSIGAALAMLILGSAGTGWGISMAVRWLWYASGAS